jgi:6-phosphogluconolactonase/glucosamine-6-phosphate isomerase/deaminase
MIHIQGDQKVSVNLMITPLSQQMSLLPHYFAQSDCLTADRQGQGDTRLTLTPSVIHNSNYIIMVSD